MPELPEVQTIVDTLRPQAVGRLIARVAVNEQIVHPPDITLQDHLVGRTIKSITRRGKRIVFRLDNGNRFYVHLGMTGRLMIAAPAQAVEKHTHLILQLAASQIRFRDPRRFGGVWWLGIQSHSENLGPEPLTLHTAELQRRLRATARAIKTVLLDQTVIAGLGNIYADESLYAARIHPQSPAKSLSSAEIRRLNRAIKLTLRRALRHRGSTLRDYVDATGSRGAFQKLHRVYGRAGLPCPACGAMVQRVVIGGRSTHFCPRCQRSRLLARLLPFLDGVFHERGLTTNRTPPYTRWV